MGTAPEKTFYVGQSLNDDIYHTLVFKRRGIKIRAVVDDDTPVLGAAAAWPWSSWIIQSTDLSSLVM